MRDGIARVLGVEKSAGSLSRRIALGVAAATAFAALTAVGARVQFHLPFTPVPVTGQVFCVLLAGCALGPRLGLLSQAEYLAAGAAGLPVFAFGGGAHALVGPTGGYLMAFPIAALVVGAVAGGAGRRRGRGWSFAACLSGVPVIYVLGAAWYGVWCWAAGTGVEVGRVIGQAVVPFVCVDVVKAALAAAAAPALARRLPVD